MKTRTVTHELPVISAASNEELLRLMARKHDSRSVADQAFTEFYNRHRQYLKARLCKAARGWLDEDGVSDLVQDTFLRVYEKAHTYKGKGLQDELEERKFVRAWLNTTAINLLRDWLRTRKGLRFENFDDEKVVWEAENKLRLARYARFHQSPETELIHRAFDCLSEREQAVLRIYGQFASPDDQQLTIPDAELEDLARNLDTSKENIRQIKKRARDKIEKYVELHSQQKGGNQQ